ncbi:unnamed protein product [Caenorhabditis auriculariae]|uniref:Uncharacterized protein n=1 Tax=Caenorhabditis auriculariae TaxID=2777116 RepID=A0A8S1HLE5_9PELO|nr:unnamed protein product [Caenorhabditis auriculariae]
MIVRSEFGLELPTKTVHERILDKCLEWPEKTALVAAEDANDSITFKQLHDYSLGVSAWLQDHGYIKGDIALICTYNDWRYFPFILGCWNAGLIVSCASPQFTKYELSGQLEDATAKLVVGLRTLRKFVPPKFDLKIDLLLLPYSSGTTGKPKGVMITHMNYSSMLTSFVLKTGKDMVKRGLPEDFALPMALQFLPIYHAMGLFRSFVSIYQGTTQIIMAKVDLKRVLELVQEHALMQLSLVPAVLLRLCDSPLMSKFDLSSVLSISSGSAPLPQSAVRKIQKILPNVRIGEGYGMTELTCASHFMSPESPPGSIGRLVPGTEMKVISENGNECGVGQIGECWIRGPQVMKGYWRQPEKTAEVLNDDGFLRTGDIVWFDERGDTFICDRAKELIKVNGKQVAPAELESVLLEHEAVRDACVFGVVDERRGEAPVATVVVSSDVDVRQLEDFVGKKLAPYKRLKAIEFVKEIARTSTGKNATTRDATAIYKRY